MKKIENLEMGIGDKTLIVDFMTHQLRTSLNTIIGFSDFLNKKSLPEEARRSYTEYIYHSSINLLQLHNNLLDLHRIHEGDSLNLSTDCLLPKLLDELYQKYSLEIEKQSHQGVRLKLVIPNVTRYSSIVIDEKKLGRVLENLIENAISFSSEGIVEFGYTEDSDHSIKFFVRDRGAGFSLDKLEELFALFISSKKTLDVSFDLVAIRAVVAKHFVHILGSELRSSSVLTMGSTFHFTLPIKESDGEVSIDFEKQPHEANIWIDRTILIAEDVETNFRLVEEFLLSTGVKLDWARNGKEAVDKFTGNPNYNAVLMDIIMPEMDGFEAAEKIRDISSTVPIIAQTAYTPDQSETDSKIKCFNDFIIKPIWKHDLVNLLSKYFD